MDAAPHEIERRDDRERHPENIREVTEQERLAVAHSQ
jgi:hypothetical protein